MLENRRRYFTVAALFAFTATIILTLPAADAATKKKTKRVATTHVRWQIKTSIPAGADISQAKAVDLQTMLAIEPPPGAKGHSRKMDKDRYPAAQNANGLTEGDIISVQGWIHLIAAEKDDQDYHIQMAQTANSQARCLIVEVPRPTAAIVKDTRVRQAAADVRQAIQDKALDGKTIKLGSVRVLDPPVFAKVTGQFFYDDWHIGGTPRGKKGCKSPTIAEIHPITAIEFPPNPQ